MPRLVSSILTAIPGLSNVALLCAFVCVLFGIVGLELFMGALHFRCAPQSSGDGASFKSSIAPLVNEFHRRALKGSTGKGGNGDTGIFCRADPTVCPSGTACEYFDDNPNGGTLSFDNILWACLYILQVQRRPAAPPAARPHVPAALDQPCRSRPALPHSTSPAALDQPCRTRPALPHSTSPAALDQPCRTRPFLACSGGDVRQ